MNEMMWAYRAVFTQTTSTGTVTISITAQDAFEFLYGQIGRDDYASARQIGVDVQDSAGNVIGTLSAFVGMDNQTAAVPTYIIAVGRGNELNLTLKMGATDAIAITATSLLATETLTIALRGLISTTKPVVTAVTSAGTIPVAVTYDKVI